MNKSNKKKVLLNLVTGSVNQVVTIVLGFLIPRLILTNFGSEVNGLLTSINQIFTYFYLLEAGVGIASLQALYEPIVNEDYDATNRILTATNKYYHRTGIAWAVLLFVFAVAYSWFSPSALSFRTIFTLIMIMGTPVAFSYLVQGTYRIFLEADGKLYVVQSIVTVVHIVSNVMKIAAIYLTHNIILVQAAFYVAPLIQPIIVVLYVKKQYKWCDVKHPKPNYEAISQKSAALVHQICAVVFANSDVVLLTFMTNYKVVSVYAVYYLIYEYAGRLFDTLSTSYNFSLAQLFHRDQVRFKRVFEYYETLYTMILFIYFSMVFLFTTPFIRLYTAGVTDAVYIDRWLPLLFVLVRLLQNGKMPTQNLINYAEHIEKTKYHAYLETGLNLGISIVGIHYFGIYGALIGTIVALLVRCVLAILYSYRNLLGVNPLKSFMKWIVNFAVFFLMYLFVLPRIGESANYIELFVGCIPVGILVVVSYALINGIFQFRSFRDAVQDYLGSRKTAAK